MTDIFDALTAPARRAIMDALAQRDEQTLFELMNRLRSDHALTLTRQAISQHLAVLDEAGLVERRREGRYTFHTLNTAPLREIPQRWPDRSTS
ncbi:ArsR/SmtB family transcription factor [Demequina flava]|uniref:ArsR/SmtB family transcription factor n=1 Tax=Demequina flava TaxID=1095025 RepID=UPI0007849C41|nr:metalloregulator ArsR/SmtB family transcription factor [Demequina flava]